MHADVQLLYVPLKIRNKELDPNRPNRDLVLRAEVDVGGWGRIIFMQVFLQLFEAMYGFSHLIKDISIFYTKNVQNEKKGFLSKTVRVGRIKGTSVTIFSTRTDDLI